MAKKPATPTKTEFVINAPAITTGELKCLGGTKFDPWNELVGGQVQATVWQGAGSLTVEQKERIIGGAICALVAIEPKDALEAMMGAQLVAAHNASMECFRRAMLPDQTFDGRQAALSQANKLSRTFATLSEALNRHRGKGQQKVTVEHVHVHAGGQAVVGAVSGGGGGASAKFEEQPHAQVTDASQSAMRGEDAGRCRVLVASDAERPMPDARRRVAGGSHG